MKKILFFILLTLSILAKEKVVIYADENYPPYSYVEKGNLLGIYVEIVKEINKNIEEYYIELEPIPWIRGLKMLEEGKAYGLIPPYYRPEERPYILYSTPILKEELVVIGYDKGLIEWPKGITGKKVGINRGFSIFTGDEKKLFSIEEANSTSENLLKLIHGRTDYYVSDKYSIMFELKKMQERKVIKSNISNKIKEVYNYRQEWGYIGFSKVYNFSKRNEFENLVNKEIEKMKKNGTIDIIVKKFIE